MAEKYQISDDPKDIEAGLAPEHYGDPEASCDGVEDPAPDGFLDETKQVWANARASMSSYPARPGSVSQYGSASSRGWGSGWPNCTSDLTTIVGGDVRVTMRRQIAEITRLLLNYCEDKLGYEILSGQTGGYNCRPIGGTTTPSNHSWGLAIDINWQTNPMSSTFRCDMPPKMISAFWACGFYWGGWYAGGRYDTMHFEYVGKPSTVAAHLAKAKELSGQSLWGTYYAGELGSRVMTMYDRGDDVKWVQTRLGLIPADGAYGTAVRTAVVSFQTRNQLETDGEVGPMTLGQLKKPQVSLTGLARAHDAGGTAEGPNSDTKQVQERLNLRGYPCGTPDGWYGERTKSAMTAFRAAKYNTYAGHPDTLGPPGAESLTDLGFSVIV